MFSGSHTSVIRDNIEGNRLIEKPDYIRDIVDSMEFQRLRMIRQMGLASYVFPTAEHSRFAHSLGVFGNAQTVYEHLRDRAKHHNLITSGLRFDDFTGADFCIAALCHDLGHTAFSHVLGGNFLPNGCETHEDCTVKLLDGDTTIANAIDNAADKEAVIALIEKRHANQALNDLISGVFDVDRCDYVLRDSYMSGVEYGQFDLKWLIRALNIELNPSGRPILLLDGPRGMDGLRQFLSARRYMHRQVYFHRAVRSIQLLFQSIFERARDLGSSPHTRSITPKTLHYILKDARPTLGEFIQTTDVELLSTVRNYAENHKDPVQKYLCELFVKRQIPKCILDSARLRKRVSEVYRIVIDPRALPPVQQEMWQFLTDSQSAVLEKLRPHVAEQMNQSSLPGEAANYLVKFDNAQFTSILPADFLFSFEGAVIPYGKIDSDIVGFDLSALLEEFSLMRLFVPKEVVGEAKEFLDHTYGIQNT